MTVAPKKSNIDLLRNLIPLNTLSDEALKQLFAVAKFSKVNAGDKLFSEGDTEVERVYLLSGRIALTEQGDEAYQISAGDSMARYPLAHHVPRKYSAVAKSKSEFVSLDNTLLGDLLAASSNSSYEVEEVEGDLTDDWMSQLLQSPIFQQIPAANIQQVMMHMEELEVVAGETVIHEGEEGDFFYLINSGSALVSRAAQSGKVEEIANLGPGTTFGEESLLSDTPRGSTVTMLGDGVLQRLDKDHFIDLVKTPLAGAVDYEEAIKKVEAGAIWIDVRSEAEHENSPMPGSLNIPFGQLRKRMSELDHSKPYIVYCQDGVVSSTAVYLLLNEEYQAQVLSRGLHAVPTEVAEETAADAGGPTDDGEKGLEGDPRELSTAMLDDEAGLLRHQLHATEEQVQAQILHIRKMKLLINKLKANLDGAGREKEASLLAQAKQKAQLTEVVEKLNRLEKTQKADEKRLKESSQSKLALEKAREELQQQDAKHSAAQQTAETALKELTLKLDSAEQTLSDAQKVVKEKSLLETQADVQQKALSAAEEQSAELQSRVDKQKEDADALQQKLQEMDAFVKQAQQEADDSRSIAESKQEKLEADIERLNGELELAKQSLETTKSEFQSQDESTKQLDQLQAELNRLQQEASGSETRQQELSTQLETSTALVTKLTEERNDLENQKTTAQQALEALQQTQSEQTAKIAEGQDLGRERDALRAEVDALKDENADLQKNHSTQIQASSDEMTSLGSERDELKTQVDGLTQDVSDLKGQHSSQVKALSEEMSALSSERDGLKAQVDGLTQSVVQMEGQQTTQAQAASEEVSSLASERDELKAQVDSLTQSMADLEGRNSTQVQASSDEKSALASERDELKTQVDTLTLSMADLEGRNSTQVQASSDENSALVSERDELKTQVEELTQRTKELEGQNSNQALASSDEMAALVADRDELKSQVDALTQKTTDLQNTLSTQQQASDQESELRAERDVLSNQYQAAQVEVEKLQKALTERSQDDQASAAAEVAGLNDSMSQLKSEMSEKDAELAAANEKQEQLQISLDALQANSPSEQDVALLRQELEEARSEKEEAVTALEAATASSSDGENSERVRVLEVELKTLNQALDDADSAYEELLQKSKTAEPVVSPEAEKERSDMAVALNQANSQVDELQNQLQQVQTQAEADSLSFKNELETIEMKAKERQLGGEADAAENEVLRQEMDALRLALKERQIELEQSHKAGAQLEERIEERDSEVDRVNVALQLAHETLTQAEREKQDALEAQQSSELAYETLKQDMAGSSQFRDELVDPRINSASLAAGGGASKQGFKLVPVLVAAAVAFGLADLLSIVGGKGELIMGFMGSKGTPTEVSVAPETVAEEVTALTRIAPEMVTSTAPQKTEQMADPDTQDTEIIAGTSVLATEPVAESNPIPEREEVVEPEPEAELVTEPESEPEIAVELEPEPVSESEVAAELEPEPETELIVETLPESSSESELADQQSEVVQTSQPEEDESNEPKNGTVVRDILRSGGRTPDMVYVRGGTFTMGSDRSQLNSQERPAHSVAVSSFVIGRYEVTYLDYSKFARATGRSVPSDLGWGEGRRPVINVSWEDATSYASWLSEQTGENYRLPTEAEWEYAAAAGSETLYWWGHKIGENQANCFNCGSQWDALSTAPVGSFDANAFGLYNTAGNVMEWVTDCYHNNYDDAPLDGSAWVEQGCRERVVRGGAFNKPSASLHTTRRGRYEEDTKLFVLGFRLARDVELTN